MKTKIKKDVRDKVIEFILAQGVNLSDARKVLSNAYNKITHDLKAKPK